MKDLLQGFAGAWKALFHSRKFWLAVVGVAQIVLVNGFGLPDAVWQGILAILMFLIGSIAHEDAAEKRNENK